MKEVKSKSIVNFEKINGEIVDTVFESCIISEATIVKVRFKDCKFINCDFTTVSVIGSYFDNCIFNGCKFNGLGLMRNSLDISMKNGNITMSYFCDLNIRCNMTGTILRYVKVFGCNFYNSEITSVMFKYSDLKSTNFTQCSLDVLDELEELALSNELFIINCLKE